MKYDVKTINVTMLEKENGEKYVIFPDTKVVLVVDAAKAVYDEWFVEHFYKKYYDAEKNVYNFEIYNVNISKNSISGFATGRKDFLKIHSNRSWLLDVFVSNENSEYKELDIIRYALDYLHDADLSNLSEEEINNLESVMTMLNVPFTPFL